MAQGLDREKMKLLRKSLGMSQGEAASRAGIPGGPSQWSDIENGHKPNVTIETLNKIAVALQCDVRDLIQEPPPVKSKGKVKK